MQDVFDVPALVQILRDIRAQTIRVDRVDTDRASPFARSLMFAYVATYLYEGDAPLAERRAQALNLDRDVLRELLGEEELRALLDADVITTLEAELQCTAHGRRAQTADDIVDLLSRVGDLSHAELADRSEIAPEAVILQLLSAKRICSIALAGSQPLIRVEDAALYRDAFDLALPPGIPEVFLAKAASPVEQILLRYARRRGPFTTQDVADRFGFAGAQAEAHLCALADGGELVAGEFHPSGQSSEWCHTDILRRIKKRTLAKLRGEVAPVSAEVFARFLPSWHGIGRDAGSRSLFETLSVLEGMPVSYVELESKILPARVRNFSPQMLDELGAAGSLVWVGASTPGTRDGKVALFRRENIAALLPECAEPDDLGEVHQGVLKHLSGRGASFFVAISQSVPGTTREDLLAALWDLVWLGLVTNDTFGPLRALSSRSKASRQKHHAAAGRWSMVADLLTATTPTEKAHATAHKLLLRHGVVTREMAQLERIPGGYSAIYRVLSAMEEAGKIRRGYFVEGLGGTQFALPGVVDRLRASRAKDPDDDELLLLSAVDPANPFGWILPWPTEITASNAKRASGAVVVISKGRPLLYLERGARRATVFRSDGPEELRRAAGCLSAVAGSAKKKYIRIETINGEIARGCQYAETFKEAGFVADHRGLVLEAGRR